MNKIVVIGANHAGASAINTILTLEPDADVTVIEQNSNVSYLGCGTALLIGKQIEGPDGLFYCSKDKLEAQGAKVFMETAVEKIDFQNKKVVAKSKDATELIKEYDKLILATGSTPIIPNVPGIDLENVQLVKLYQNTQDVINKMENEAIKNITIIGAGYIGVELAEAFQLIGKKVTLVDIADRCLSGYYDKSFSDKVESKLSEHNIQMKFNTTLKEIKGDKKVEKIVTDKGEFDSDMVIVAIGFEPNSNLGHNDIDLFDNGAYIVNDKQETSLKDVYAIGDCATVYDNSIGGQNYIALATNAVRGGVVAGYNICGKNIDNVGVQGSNGICIYDYKMVATGLTFEKAIQYGYDAAITEFEDMQKPEFMDEDNESVNIAIVYDKSTRRILGAQVASYYDISLSIHMFSLAIQEKITIDKIKLTDIFFLPHFNKPYNYITMAALGAE